MRASAPLFLCMLLAVCSHGAPVLEIEQVLAGGKPVAYAPSGVVLPAGRHDLEIRFRTQGQTPWGWIAQYQLEGHDISWRSVDGEMAMMARVLDVNGNELTSIRAAVPAQPMGWMENLRRADLNRRIEPIVVPKGGHSLEIVFDSGTWRPELTGDWTIAEVTVNRPGTEFGPEGTFWQNPDLRPAQEGLKDNFPEGWTRLGDVAITRLAKSPDPREKSYLLKLQDSSKAGAGAWVCRQPLPSGIAPGEVLTIGWWERSRVESERSYTARYSSVPPGRMLFRAVGRGVGASFLGDGVVLPIIIRPYVWAEPWFAPLVTVLGGSLLALWAWLALRRRYRMKLARLELESRIDKDRARIARDMHDELGASLTRIALMSDLAAFEPEVTPAAAQRFGEIARAARSVSGTLDEIVWTVNPRNDTLERLVGYLGEFTSEYLGATGISLKLELPPASPAQPIASEVRHHVLLGVKEALNNLARYAAAQSATVRVSFDQGVMTITIADDGRGFDLASVSPSANGLRNMRQRFVAIGGSTEIRSAPGAGTTVTFRIPLETTGVSPQYAT